MGALFVVWRTTVDYMKGSSIAGLTHAANAPTYLRSAYWCVLTLDT